jgi:hypothetical protein
MNIIYNSRLILKDADKSQAMFFCHGHKCTGEQDDVAYSNRHSTELGWRSTKDRHWSPTGDTVLLCPDCCKQIKEEDEKLLVSKSTGQYIIEKDGPCKYS